MDEQNRNDSESNPCPEIPGQELDEIALATVQHPEVPPSIMEQIAIMDRQYPNRLTEEEYQAFCRNLEKTGGGLHEFSSTILQG